jgi:hypothetical protein
MTDGKRLGPSSVDGAGSGEPPPCTALVPMVPGLHRARLPGRPLSRADFVTQLIATAEHAPQTRVLRRASPADAQVAYGARPSLAGAGVRTRQVI